MLNQSSCLESAGESVVVATGNHHHNIMTANMSPVTGGVGGHDYYYGGMPPPQPSISPQNIMNSHQQQQQVLGRPSTDSNLNPNSMISMGYNPFEKGKEMYGKGVHAQQQRDESYQQLDRSKVSLNENDKSITPDYIADVYNNDPQGLSSNIVSPISKISQVNSQGRGNDLSSVTEETLDGFEQSEVVTTNRHHDSGVQQQLAYTQYGQSNGYDERVEKHRVTYQPYMPDHDHHANGYGQQLQPPQFTAGSNHNMPYGSNLQNVYVEPQPDVKQYMPQENYSVTQGSEEYSDYEGEESEFSGEGEDSEYTDSQFSETPSRSQNANYLDKYDQNIGGPERQNMTSAQPIQDSNASNIKFTGKDTRATYNQPKEYMPSHGTTLSPNHVVSSNPEAPEAEHPSEYCPRIHDRL